MFDEGLGSGSGAELDGAGFVFVLVGLDSATTVLVAGSAICGWLESCVWTGAEFSTGLEDGGVEISCGCV